MNEYDETLMDDDFAPSDWDYEDDFQDSSSTLDDNDFSEEDDPLFGYGEEDDFEADSFDIGDDDFENDDVMDEDFVPDDDADLYFGEDETDEELSASEDAMFSGDDDYSPEYDDFENGAEYDDIGSDSYGYSDDEGYDPSYEPDYLDDRSHDYDAVGSDIYDDDHFAESKKRQANKPHITESSSKKTRKALQFIQEASKILKSVDATKFKEEIDVLSDIHANLQHM